MYILTNKMKIIKVKENSNQKNYLRCSETLKGLCDFFLIYNESGGMSIWNNVFMEGKPCHIDVFGCILYKKEDKPILRAIIKLSKKGEWRKLKL